jgi:GT2 family glycosyltransferase
LVSRVDDLAIIIVSYHGERWLPDCLTSVLEHAGDCTLDVVVVNNADDGTEEVLKDFPWVRLIKCENRGFSHANNQALVTCDARYALLLNPDTRILDGTFEELVTTLDARPSVGLAGVRQVMADGQLIPTMRHFPNAVRALGDAFGLERLPFEGASWLGERQVAIERYEKETPCDWSSGSFLVARSEVLSGVGLMDERFFMYCEEPDLCLRARQGGWETRHFPLMTILHYGGDAAVDPRLAAQDAFSRMQYARKHFKRAHRAAYRTALGLGCAVRALRPEADERRQAKRSALRLLVGLSGPPFLQPPAQAVSSTNGPSGPGGAASVSKTAAPSDDPSGPTNPAASHKARQRGLT